MNIEELRQGAVVHRNYIVELMLIGQGIQSRMKPDSPNLPRIVEAMNWLNDYIAAVDKFIAGGDENELLKTQEGLIDKIQFMKKLVTGET